MSKKPSTFENFVQMRQENDRPAIVHVAGDTRADPPEGRAWAKRAAHVLKGDEGSVIEVDLEEGIPSRDYIAPWSVLLFTMPVQPDPHEIDEFSRHDTWEHWKAIRQFLCRSRIRRDHVLIHAPKVPNPLEGVLDIRIYPENNKLVRITLQPFEKERIGEEPLGGFTNAE